MTVCRLGMLLVVGFFAVGSFHSVSRALSEPENPKKRTTLGKYVDSVEAYEMWRSKPDQVKILDVRTPEEYVYVGHPSMARNIPFKEWKGQWNSKKKGFDLTENPDFVGAVKKHYAPNDTILVMCRSGDRSAEAVDALAKEGFTNAYSVVDSFEGDLVTDEHSCFFGKRMRSGWKNSGIPWTYELDAKLVYIPIEPQNK
jgi:rhodanese-related sulfurtransferase